MQLREAPVCPVDKPVQKAIHLKLVCPNGVHNELNKNNSHFLIVAMALALTQGGIIHHLGKHYLEMGSKTLLEGETTPLIWNLFSPLLLVNFLPRNARQDNGVFCFAVPLMTCSYSLVKQKNCHN